MFENLISSTDDQLLVENKSVSEDYNFECSCKLESRLLPRLLVEPGYKASWRVAH